jgi:hypothetical protein
VATAGRGRDRRWGVEEVEEAAGGEGLLVEEVEEGAAGGRGLLVEEVEEAAGGEGLLVEEVALRPSRDLVPVPGASSQPPPRDTVVP